MALMDGARVVVSKCLSVRKGERVLVVSDNDSRPIGESLFNAALEQEAEAVFMEMLKREEDGQEPPRMVAQAMKPAGVVILATSYSLTHTVARRAANRKGARIVSMPGVTADGMSRGSLTADYREVSARMKKASKYLVNAKAVEITSELGTDLRLITKKRPWVMDDDGLCFKKGTFTTLPAGELFVAPVEHMTKGKLVIDGYFEQELEKPVELEITRGVAVKIRRARFLKKLLDEHGKKLVTVSKLGIGFNPNTLLTTEPYVARKREGAVSLGFGGNASFGGRINLPLNLTCVLNNATLAADGKTIVEEGKLVV